MSLPRTASYDTTIWKLRDDLHRDVVQTTILLDVNFIGHIEFEKPLDVIHTYYDSDTKFKFQHMQIVGIDWEGNIVAENHLGEVTSLRYNNVTIEHMNEMLRNLRAKKFTMVRWNKTIKDLQL